jgi:hypothetical protein
MDSLGLEAQGVYMIPWERGTVCIGEKGNVIEKMHAKHEKSPPILPSGILDNTVELSTFWKKV